MVNSNSDTEESEKESISIAFYGQEVNDDNVKELLEDAIKAKPDADQLDLGGDKITGQGIDIVTEFLSKNRKINKI